MKTNKDRKTFYMDQNNKVDEWLSLQSNKGKAVQSLILKFINNYGMVSLDDMVYKDFENTSEKLTENVPCDDLPYAPNDNDHLSPVADSDRETIQTTNIVSDSSTHNKAPKPQNEDINNDDTTTRPPDEFKSTKEQNEQWKEFFKKTNVSKENDEELTAIVKEIADEHDQELKDYHQNEES